LGRSRDLDAATISHARSIVIASTFRLTTNE